MISLLFNNVEDAYDHIIENPNSSWKKEIEKIILTDPVFSFYYSKNVLKKRWKEAEEIISNSYEYYSLMENYFSYVKFVIKGRWPKYEKFILKSDKRYLDFFRMIYLNEVINERIKIFEKFLKPNYNSYLKSLVNFDHE